MPMNAYIVLRSMCDAPGSPEYSMLRTGFIVRDKGTEDVTLFCNHADADLLLDLASRKCPQLRSQIKLTVFGLAGKRRLRNE
jgi:hypothetical protein